MEKPLIRAFYKILLVVNSEWREYPWFLSFLFLFLFLSKHDLVVTLNKNKPRQLPTGKLQACFKKILIVTAGTTPRNTPVFQGHKRAAQKLVGEKRGEKCPQRKWHPFSTRLQRKLGKWTGSSSLAWQKPNQKFPQARPRSRGGSGRKGPGGGRRSSRAHRRMEKKPPSRGWNGPWAPIPCWAPARSDRPGKRPLR